jgi:hypothetical protein
MAKTYTLIQTQTLASATSSITFSNIPQNYRDLVIKVSARGTYAGTITDFGIAFNGGNRISDTEFSLVTLYTNATSPTSFTRAAFGYNHLFYIPASTATADTFSNGEIYIPNYTSSTNKSVSIDGVNENNASANYNALTAGLRSNTAAITSITLSPYENFATKSTFYLYGVDGTRATGGTISADGNYTYHTFTSTTLLTAYEKITNAEVLVVGGGGGGGNNVAGGGGGGGVLYSNRFPLTAGTSYTALIGAGGAAGSVNSYGISGANSSFGAVVAVGGGGGGARTGSGDKPPFAGGSGGGGAGDSSGTNAGAVSNQTTPTGTSTVAYGNSGGSGASSGTSFSGGGGGGAGAAGSAATGVVNNSTTGRGGNGGAGTFAFQTWALATGTGDGLHYAGGGGGGSAWNVGSADSGYAGGGIGGGGQGGSRTQGYSAGTYGAGFANTGGGGGGGANDAGYVAGGVGGSGIIIIRYPNT